MSATLENVTLRGNTQIVGQLRVPGASISNNDIAAGANIDASKLVHRHALGYHQAGGASIAAAAVPLHIVRGTTASVIAIEAAILTAAAGAAEVTIDLERSTGGGAFASVLTAPIAIDDSTVVRTVVAGTIDTATLADNDVLQLVVTADAGGGTLPQGLVVTVTIDETAA